MMTTSLGSAGDVGEVLEWVWSSQKSFGDVEGDFGGVKGDFGGVAMVSEVSEGF